MCGIGGKLFFDPARRVDPSVLRAMNAVLGHRGPDDEGVWANGPVGFAHRRLSIIDLSPSGHQPMASADGAVWITYNGEVYNFLELRAELEGEGVHFRSRSDTEVILALYDRHGAGCLERLRGMFALALWDGRRRALLLARDRVGKKPLHYYRDREKLVFASEPKGIFADPDVPSAADFEAIHHYLTYGYVPAPWSAFRGLRKVPPGHYVEIGADGTLATRRYWRLRYRPKLRLNEAEACEALLAHLREAVRLRLIADVPVGAFLSGGVDSSGVVALMSEVGAVKTFSIGFEEAEYDELPYARLVARRYGTDHTEHVVKPDAVEVLPRLVWHYNEPFADSSAIPSYYLAEMARQHVTVALNGDGGDESFAGYQRYRLNALAARYDALPAFIRRPVALGLRALPPLGPPAGLLRRLRRFGGDVGVETRRRYARWIALLDEKAKARLYTPELRALTTGLDSTDVLLAAYAAADTADIVDATLGADVATYLPDDLLVKMDIATMAHGLEARSPLLDHRVMEFAAALPSGFKLRGGDKKYLLRRTLGPFLPAEILDRPKRGFAVPLPRWFRGPLRELAHDVLLGRTARERGMFEASEIRRMLDEHASGRARWDAQLWALLVLELWFERFIDPARTLGPSAAVAS